MVNREDYLRILGLEPGAYLKDIKDAYRELAMVWHPDRFPSGSDLSAKAEREFKRITEAYQALLAEASDFGSATIVPASARKAPEEADATYRKGAIFFLGLVVLSILVISLNELIRIPVAEPESSLSVSRQADSARQAGTDRLSAINRAESNRRRALCDQWSPQNPRLADDSGTNWYSDSVSVEQTRLRVEGANILSEGTTYVRALVRNRSTSVLTLRNFAVRYVDANGDVIGERFACSGFSTSCANELSPRVLRPGYVADLRASVTDRPSVTRGVRVYVNFSTSECIQGP